MKPQQMEKIDIVLWAPKDEQFIINALSPAKVEKVKLSKKEKKARVEVLEDQLSLAIGKGGQNVRLASKISGWNIDVEKFALKPPKKSDEGKPEAVPAEKDSAQPDQSVKEPAKSKKISKLKIKKSQNERSK